MAKALWGLATDPRLLLASTTTQLGRDPVAPGSVARSVLAGCFALNPILRTVHSDTAQALLNDDVSIPLESGTRLYLAIARGPKALVAGGISGFTLFRLQESRAFSWAQIYFPPLAWQLVLEADTTLMQQQGWVDLSSWSTFPSDLTRPLSSLVPALPLVVHPRQDPAIGDYWSELFHDEACFVVLSDNATRQMWTDSA